MPNLLDFLGPYKYALYAAAAAIALSAAAYAGHRVTSLAWQADMATQERTASALYIDALNTKAAVERANTDLARKVDQDAADAQVAADAGRDDFARRLHDARSWARGPGTGCGKAASASVGAEPAAVSEPGPGSPDPGSRLRDAALELQRYARACHEWAVGVGR